jgi:hypothetical protein
MIKVSRIVDEIVRESDFVEIALANNFLNLTEFARYIKKDIQKRTMKTVNTGTIVVALSRLKKQQAKSSLNKPKFRISELSIKSPLCEIVYEKNQKNLFAVKNIHNEIQMGTNVFLTVTQSSSEIMITTNNQLKNTIVGFFQKSKPKVLIEDLVGISIRLEGEIPDQPGILYSFLKVLAWENISIVDLVSTYTEFIVIVRRSHAKEAFAVINDLYTSKNQI